MKKTQLFGVIGAIAFVLYNLLVFSIFGFAGHQASFWTSYIFVVIAFATVTCSVWLLGAAGMEMKDWLFGLPIVRHCIIYCSLELVFSVLFMILDHKVSPVLAFVVQVILLAVYLMFAIACYISKMTIDEIHQNVQKKTRYLDLLRAEAELNVNKCTDPQLKKQCRELAEAIRYSDPISSPALIALEQKLMENVIGIGNAIDIGNTEMVHSLCAEAQQLLLERNLKTKTMK